MIPLIAQIFGWASTFCSVITYIFRSRRAILSAKVSADLTSVIHYFLLGAFTGGLMCAINVVRDILYYHRDSKITSHILCPITFIALNLLSCAFSWLGWVSLLPAVGSSIGVIGLRMRNPVHIRIIMVFAIALWLIYGILIGSVPTVISNTFTLISLSIGLTRDWIEWRKKQTA